MAELKNISEIFDSKTIYRIPDYQRGFSWEKEHLEALWNDIENITESRKHYTGAIKLVKIAKEDIKKEEINQKFDRIFSIVDGQQRITTVLIWISIILQNIKDDDEFEKEDELHSYIYFTPKKTGSEKTYIFGYDYDDPSYNYLKQNIFENSKKNPEIETLYTKNLKFAKEFIINKINKWDFSKKQELFKKITKKLVFDYIILDDSLDINVIFETENNRGKDLSNLEKLKNRLIFLSSLNEEDKKYENLRQKINETWRIIYQVIGMSERFSDDDFLKSHWIMYCRYVKTESESYAKDIFERVFFTSNLNNKITFEDINNYVENLQESIIYWYIIHNPNDYIRNKDISKIFKLYNLKIDINSEQINWLEKLNMLGFKMFKPIILASFFIKSEDDEKTNLLKAIEKYIFVIFAYSQRRSYTGRYNFYRAANRLFDKDTQNIFFETQINKIKIPNLVKEINNWTDAYYYENDFDGYNTETIANWKEIYYLLYVYENQIPKDKLELPEFIKKRWGLEIPLKFTKDADGHTLVNVKDHVFGFRL